MSTAALSERIEAEFANAKQRVSELQKQKSSEYEDRQQRLERLDGKLGELARVWRPRLETLAAKFGEHVKVQPQLAPGRRDASFKFDSELANVELRFGVSSDSDVRNVVFTYDLRVIPVLMKFESHSEVEFPLDSVDEKALAAWIDDRIVNFVRTYLSLHENEYYLKDHMVTDPVAKVSFPKYAAAATAEDNGKIIYFISQSTRERYQGGKD